MNKHVTEPSLHSCLFLNRFKWPLEPFVRFKQAMWLVLPSTNHMVVYRPGNFWALEMHETIEFSNPCTCARSLETRHYFRRRRNTKLLKQQKYYFWINRNTNCLNFSEQLIDRGAQSGLTTVFSSSILSTYSNEISAIVTSIRNSFELNLIFINFCRMLRCVSAKRGDLTSTWFPLAKNLFACAQE